MVMMTPAAHGRDGVSSIVGPMARLRASADISASGGVGGAGAGQSTPGQTNGGLTGSMGHMSNPRPLSEFVAGPRQAQNLEALALDRWYEDVQQHEAVLEEMLAASIDPTFKEELSAIEQWFKVLSEAERTAALYSLLQHSTGVQIRFFITVLQQMASSDPNAAALLSPRSHDSLEAQMEARLASQNNSHHSGVNKNHRQQRATSEFLGTRDGASHTDSIFGSSSPFQSAYEQKLRTASFGSKRVSAPGDIFDRHLKNGSNASSHAFSGPWRRDESASLDHGSARSPQLVSSINEKAETSGNSWTSVASHPGATGAAATGALGPLPGGRSASGPLDPDAVSKLSRFTGSVNNAGSNWGNNGKLTSQQQAASRRTSANQSYTAQQQLSPLLYDPGSFYEDSGNYLSPAGNGNLSRRASSSSSSRSSSPQPAALGTNTLAGMNALAASQMAAAGVNLGMINQMQLNNLGMMGMLPSLGVMPNNYLGLPSAFTTGTTASGGAGLEQPTRQRRASHNKSINEEVTDPRLLNEDVASWLKSLRLHKYTPNFENTTWKEMMEMDEQALEERGVLALGARRKMLKVFAELKDILNDEERGTMAESVTPAGTGTAK